MMKIIANVGKSNSGLPNKWTPASKFHKQELIDYLKTMNMTEFKLCFIEGLKLNPDSAPGLHPLEQRDLIEELLSLDIDVNLEFTTHSPYIVDELEANQVRVWCSDKFKLLSEHPSSSYNLKVLTTGEFWSAEGEEWVFK